MKSGIKCPDDSITFSDERGADPVLMVDVLPVGISLGAERAFAVGVLLGSLNLDDHPILHVGVYAAVREWGLQMEQMVLRTSMPVSAPGTLPWSESLTGVSSPGVHGHQLLSVSGRLAGIHDCLMHHVHVVGRRFGRDLASLETYANTRPCERPLSRAA